jgi:hypothetical protein
VLEPARATKYPAFTYLQDNSYFGLASPPRSPDSWARLCGTGTLDVGPRPCPFTDTVSQVTSFSNGTITYNYPYGVNLNVPKILLDTFSSGSTNSSTVSNYFDIQFRRTVTSTSSLYNNGSAYQTGSFRSIQSLVLNNATEAIEGLVVDTVQGQVGFRNHSATLQFEHGATWSEDILFIQPQSVCVDTNLTLDFT